MLHSKKKIILFVAFWVLFITFSVYFWQIINSSNILIGEKKSQYISIPSYILKNGKKVKTSYEDLTKILKEKNIIADYYSFYLLAKFMNLDTSFKTGRYEIKPNTNNITFIRALRSGLQSTLSISFHNVRLPEDLAKRVTQNLSMTEEEFLKEFNDNELQKELGFNKDNFLCAFIPNTYEVYYNTSPKSLIKRLLSERNKFWNKERTLKAKKLGLNPLEICTLASIVQAESIKEKEHSTIAGLYYNRIKKNMKLQADPTIIFALKDFTIRRVTLNMIKTKSPYNTYKNKGLPPGPINLPTPQIIDATLNIKKHNYLFMCSKPDLSGYHLFASTLKEHEKNANRYRRELNKRKIFK